MESCTIHSLPSGPAVNKFPGRTAVRRREPLTADAPATGLIERVDADGIALERENEPDDNTTDITGMEAAEEICRKSRGIDCNSHVDAPPIEFRKGSGVGALADVRNDTETVANVTDTRAAVGS